MTTKASIQNEIIQHIKNSYDNAVLAINKSVADSAFDHEHMMLDDLERGTAFRFKNEGNSLYTALFRSGKPGSYEFINVPLISYELRYLLSKIIAGLDDHTRGDTDVIEKFGIMDFNGVLFRSSGIKVEVTGDGTVELIGTHHHESIPDSVIRVTATPHDVQSWSCNLDDDKQVRVDMTKAYFETLLAAVK